MASPQVENGYTRLANELLEVVVRTPLPGRHKDVWFFVARKTYGFGKKADYISLSQFVQGTGIDRSGVCKILKDLVAGKLLAKKGSIYAIKKDYKQWVVAQRPLGVVAGKTIRVVAHTPHTKETITKETIRDKSRSKSKDMSWKPKDSEDVDLVVDYDSGSPLNEPKPRTAKYPNARTVMRLFPNYEKHWNIKTPILQASERLFTDKGVERIVKALTFYAQNREQQMCPKIYTPIDLEDKWEKLLAFKNKS